MGPRIQMEGLVFSVFLGKKEAGRLVGRKMSAFLSLLFKGLSRRCHFSLDSHVQNRTLDLLHFPAKFSSLYILENDVKVSKKRRKKK